MKSLKILQITFCIIFIISFTKAFGSEEIYFLNIEYNQGKLTLLNINLITGYPHLSQDKTLPYELELLSSNKEILYKGFFEVPNKFYAPVPKNPKEFSGIVELDNLNFSISFPYHKEGKEIRIIKQREELLNIDVSQFSMYCGDTLCLSDENFQNCPEDCKYSEEEIQKSLKEKSFFQKTYDDMKSQKYTWLILAGILIILVVIIILIKKSRKE